MSSDLKALEPTGPIRASAPKLLLDMGACFSEAIELDLGGLAIRSMELVDFAYMIVAGPPGDHGEFALYKWSSDGQDKPEQLVHEPFDQVRPEALLAIPGMRQV